MTIDLKTLTLADAVKLLKKKEAKPSELLALSLSAIEADRKSAEPLNAVVAVHEDLAKKQIEELDASAPLSGVPLLHKDNLNVTDFPVTCGSRILEGYVSPFTGTAVGRMKKAGAVLYGRSNMDEFAMGSSTETSSYGITRNPVNRAYIPGGSSGGSAAAVAGGQAIAALGTDTGGSIRQPAAACGVVGLKPTYGRVSRYGLVAYGSSLDVIGPITKTVEDAAILLGHLAGHDPLDATSSAEAVPDYVAALGASLKGKKIGLPKEYFTKDLDASVRKNLEAVIDFYRKEGAEIVEISLPNTEYAIGTYYVLATAEASSNLARFDGIRYGRRVAADDLKGTYFKSRSEGFGLEVKRRILLGTYVLSTGYYDAYYVKAQKVRRVIRDDFAKAFEKVDLLLTPMMPEPLFKLGEKSGDPVKMYLSDIYTISLNLAGLPGVSVPCGKDPNGLPVGVQLVAPWFGEASLLSAAHAYDKVRGH